MLVPPCPEPDRRPRPPVRSALGRRNRRRLQAGRHRPAEDHCSRHREAGNNHLHDRDNGRRSSPPRSPSRNPTTMKSTNQQDTNRHIHHRRTSEPTPDSRSGRSAKPTRRPGNSTRIRSGRATIPTVRRPTNSNRRWSSTTGRRYRGANQHLPWAARPRFLNCPGRPSCRRRPTARPRGHTGYPRTLHSGPSRFPSGPEPSGQNRPGRSDGSRPMRPDPRQSHSRRSPAKPHRPPR